MPLVGEALNIKKKKKHLEVVSGDMRSPQYLPVWDIIKDFIPVQELQLMTDYQLVSSF